MTAAEPFRGFDASEWTAIGTVTLSGSDNRLLDLHVAVFGRLLPERRDHGR